MTKHDSILKNYSKNKITLAKPKPKYLGQPPLPRSARSSTVAHDHLSKSTDRTTQNLFSFATLFLDTCQNLVSTHAPQFQSKMSFYFEINLCHDYAAECSFHLLSSRFPCGWWTKISSLPSTFHLLIHTTGICRFTFRLFTRTPLIKSRGEKLCRCMQPIHLPHLGL